MSQGRVALEGLPIRQLHVASLNYRIGVCTFNLLSADRELVNYISISDAPDQLIAHTYVAGGVVNEHNEQCRTVVAGGMQKTTDEG